MQCMQANHESRSARGSDPCVADFTLNYKMENEKTNHYSELNITACSKMGNRENNSELKITVGSRMGPCDVILMMN